MKHTSIVAYLSGIATLPCEHPFTKTSLQSVAWTKVGGEDIPVVAEYDTAGVPPVSFYGPVAGRASAEVFPPTLKFSNVSLQDAAEYPLYYQCTVFSNKHVYPFRHFTTLTVNGK